ncbi:MAG TPA: hypothetical protein VKP30_03175 [Polyangiaceae bacterium]|nr:hypothetical protein [Polyangiaceae bacterium]
MTAQTVLVLTSQSRGRGTFLSSENASGYATALIRCARMLRLRGRATRQCLHALRDMDTPLAAPSRVPLLPNF